MRFLIHFLIAVSLPSITYGYMGAVMGKLTTCDDAKTNLNKDWDAKDFSAFTCSSSIHYAVQKDIDPVFFDMVQQNSSYDPRKDQVMHKCMDESIEYEDRIPVRGDHRPNWARFGEYLYVPVQRWLHNLEHGSIVLLYHPCVDLDELNKLRQLVTSCIYRHVITPYIKLTAERPLALVGWGSRLEMNSVDEKKVVDYMKKYGNRAPEEITRDGKYDEYLIQEAKFVSGEEDSKICPNH
ncbi:Protein CBG13238 [Caenorhabditis briggsae]|nr:Protein CBG13238 [Caenorhabditis briggsae]CAP32059.2 Protein CBG13238 [Caenorhabditis briggsae]